MSVTFTENVHRTSSSGVVSSTLCVFVLYVAIDKEVLTFKGHSWGYCALCCVCTGCSIYNVYDCVWIWKTKDKYSRVDISVPACLWDFLLLRLVIRLNTTVDYTSVGTHAVALYIFRKRFCKLRNLTLFHKNVCFFWVVMCCERDLKEKH